MTRRAFAPLLFSLCCSVWLALPVRAQTPTQQLARRIEPVVNCLNGQDQAFAMAFSLEGKISGAATLSRFDAHHWRLVVRHERYALTLDRTPEETTLVLPRHRVVMRGRGEVAGADTLTPEGIIGRLVSPASQASLLSMTLTRTGPEAAATALTTLARMSATDEKGLTWRSPLVNDATLTFGAGGSMTIAAPFGNLTVRVNEPKPEAMEVPADYRVVTLDRTEMERLFARGMRRMTEVAAPGLALTQPARQPALVHGGELSWREDQRLLLLRGSPAEVGEAHGKLLREPMVRTVDSVLYLVGILDTVHTGKWFLDELRDARQRLEPFVPDDHKIELLAMAKGSGISEDELRLANVFPELFHCSGFAVLGKATADGKLYHGRVLDYMTSIGLQESAAVYVIAVKGKMPFITVGYAGFVGSVTGMNNQRISLGMMGGRGQGNYDGVPMATLMRRAMEECSTLESVKNLFSQSPRTCEYYYVFGDGKIPAAVAAAATPGKIEFIEPGEAHAKFGAGIEGTVLISGGPRLSTLRQWITRDLGKIDRDAAIALMNRPVATRINLHNTLFVPQDLMLYVSHADHDKPAAERPYVEYDFAALLESMQ